MPAAIKKKKDAAANEREVDKSKTIEHALKKLDGEVIFGKRKRDKPQAEINAEKWIDENFEEKVDFKINRTSTYHLYVKCCVQWKESSSIQREVLLGIIKERFPKGYSLKESSPFRGQVRAMSQNKKETQHKKKRSYNTSKNLIELVINGLEELGNPKCGIRVHKLKRLLADKNPVLCLYENPKRLKNALETLVRSRHVERVRGMGLSGYYRLNRAETSESEEEETKIKKENDSNESDNNSEDEDKDASSSKTDNKKRKREDGDEEAEAAEYKKPPMPKKAKIMTEQAWLAINHAEPQRFEDTFPLAFTFMSEPKTASVKKIKKYLALYYPQVTPESIVKALVNGVKKGYWAHRGSIAYELTITSFNPSHCNDTYDKICQAIVACHEPKKCSMKGVKQYIQDYHEEFNVMSMKFRLAVERSLDKGLLRQKTGLGLTGTFELSREFTPSPALLAGEEDTDVPEMEPEQTEYNPRLSKSRAKVQIKQEVDVDEMFNDRCGELYVPRPSASRGGKKPSSKAVKIERDVKHEGSSKSPSRSQRNEERKSHKRRNEKKRKAKK